MRLPRRLKHTGRALTGQVASHVPLVHSSSTVTRLNILHQHPHQRRASRRSRRHSASRNRTERAKTPGIHCHRQLHFLRIVNSFQAVEELQADTSANAAGLLVIRVHQHSANLVRPLKQSCVQGGGPGGEIYQGWTPLLPGNCVTTDVRLRISRARADPDNHRLTSNTNQHSWGESF